MVLDDLTIVVCCNKNDVFFARICIASIRYYYSNIKIEIVKDLGNGKFNTNELEFFFNVKKVVLGKEKLGWGGAKFHYLYSNPHGKKVLLLDADIVFVSQFIERLLPHFNQNDYLISSELENNPYAAWVKQIYFDTKKIENKYPNYKYPGYFFNAGQMFVTIGSINTDIINNFFDVSTPPYWRDLDTFPLVDQSVYNYLLPTLANQNKIKLGTENFMLWSKSEIANNLSLIDIKAKILDVGLIHWAGDLRRDSLIGMSRKDILQFFEQYYYSIIPFGKLKFIILRIPIMINYLLKYIFKTCKRLKIGLLQIFNTPEKIEID